MKPILASVLCSLLLAGCRPSESPEAKSDPSVLGIVGGHAIRLADLDAEIARRTAGPGPAPKPETIFQELIDRAALLAHAREIGLPHDPDVARRIENLLIAELKQRELQPRLRGIALSEESTQAAPPNPPAAPPAEQRRLAILQLTLSSRTTEARRKALEARMAEARGLALRLDAAEAGFGALAVQYSDHQESRYTGGDRGWFETGSPQHAQLPQEVLSAAAALRQPGEVSEIVQTERGIFLVRLIDRVSADSPAAANSAVVQRHRAVLSERRRVEAEFVEAARKQAGVELSASHQTHLAQAATRHTDRLVSSASTAISPAAQGWPSPAIPE